MFARLGKAILFRTAKDITDRAGARWLETDACRNVCATADVSYEMYRDAVRYLMDKSPAQRTVLLKALKKNLKV